ncbi:MAG TPA: glycine cleavage system protein H [Methylomirabilota bacterium]|nr:glycine cleavage system protein H [Methylomirabilota bacterium]
MLYRGCEFPEDLWYDVDRDVWARFEADGTVTLGMTDPAQTRCGKVVSVRFKAVGRRVARGQSAATIESAKWVGPFPAVLSGVIVATNEATFQRDILAANKDPYGSGWFVRLGPERLEEERDALATGRTAVERYRERIDSNGINCMRCAEGTDGPG